MPVPRFRSLNADDPWADASADGELIASPENEATIASISPPRSAGLVARASSKRSNGIRCAYAVAALLLCSQLFAKAPARDIDRTLLETTIEQLAAVVQREYFDAKAASAAAAMLRENLREGRYDDVTSRAALADHVTADLFTLTNDKHLAVSPFSSEDSSQTEQQQPNPSRENRGKLENFGVQRVEILPGNVGYLNLTSFYRPDEARDALAAAMHVLRHADALILDLRTNGGGSPDTAALFASYFFDEAAMPLFEIINRAGDANSYVTEPAALADRNSARPVFALTSANTFSAGEGLAFLFQERRRATIVGETTAGAANPGQPYRVNDHFEVVVPNGRVVTAISKSNWEGVGVTPDVPADASDALRVAHERALKLLNRSAID